ncbi:AAA family ATPase [Phocea massiliensis]|uniref:AAA family ATPase n=1 Tax=Merdimmobilis hominis TaxID=2897707 RepID=A0A938X967_9FIRM|nr:AAA family ATPase [Merdimmobilis hominis]MBM6921809.1 AAA family ATPase [Merdimmobilis hominis]
MDQKIFQLAASVPVMLFGAPGIGKTAAVTQFAQDIGADLIDIRLSTETPSSFEGKDYICPHSGHLKKARAWWLQRIDENKQKDLPTILFFDEYTNAPDALQQLAYSPFHERRLRGQSFDYRLSDNRPGLYVFGAGNRVEDETGAREMVYASKTRVFTVDYEVSATEWLIWAEKNNINAKIRAFIYANPDALLEKPATGTACPREWANLSAAIALGIPYQEAAHGTIRGANERKFCAFYKDSTLCPTIEEIVEGRAKRVSSVHLASFTVVLAAALSENAQVTTCFPIVYQWIAEQSAECEILFAKYAIELLAEKLLSSQTCLHVLNSAAKKMGMYVK